MSTTVGTPVVFIVDDDIAVRDSLALLCETAGLKAECYDSAEAFLAGYRTGTPGCLLLDVHMPKMTGLQLHEELSRRASTLPVIYLTAHGDIPLTVRAMKAGATDFLTKPVDGAALIDRIRAAVDGPGPMRHSSSMPGWRQQRLASLTEREREVALLAVAGHPNKAIGRQLGISFRTVELHRSRILRKTGASTMLELARLIAEAGLVTRFEPLDSDRSKAMDRPS